MNPALITELLDDLFGRKNMEEEYMKIRTEVKAVGPNLSVVASGLSSSNMEDLVNSVTKDVVERIENGSYKKGDKVHVELLVL